MLDVFYLYFVRGLSPNGKPHMAIRMKVKIDLRIVLDTIPSSSSVLGNERIARVSSTKLNDVTVL